MPCDPAPVIDNHIASPSIVDASPTTLAKTRRFGGPAVAALEVLFLTLAALQGAVEAS